MQVEYAQLPPAEDSADRIFATDDAVILLDGASAFAPVSHPPSTYADRLGTWIARALSTHPGRPLPDVVARAIGLVRGELSLNRENSPSSTVSILRARPDTIELYVLGDSPIYQGAGTSWEVLLDDRLERLPLPSRDTLRERLRGGHGYDETHWALARRSQEEQRAYRNRSRGYWIAAADPDAAHQARTRRLPRSDVEWAVLATDGAADPINHREPGAWPEVRTFNSRRLHALLTACLRWERDEDPTAEQLVRIKRHDDKAIAAVTLC